jgi:rsbT antagonist protein RsbS
MIPFSLFHIGDILLVSVQEEIDDSNIIALSRALSERVRKGNINGVVIDLGDVEVIDTFLAENIQRLGAIMKLFNTKTVVSGLGAPAIVTLKNFNITFGQELELALDTHQALRKLGRRMEEN